MWPSPRLRRLRRHMEAPEQWSQSSEPARCHLERASGRMLPATKLTKLQCGSLSHRLLDPAVPLPLLSQHHTTALPSLRRYDMRYEDCTSNSRSTDIRRFIYSKSKRCIVVAVI